MAKVPFTKLALSRNTELKVLDWKDQKIEIKQYLPVGEKLNLVSRVLQSSVDDNVFCNPCRVEIYKIIEIILTYTNINITEKQGEDVLKLYDLFVSTGLFNNIKKLIPVEELEYLDKAIDATIHEVYRYRNSARGIMEQINAEKQVTEGEIADLINTLKNSEEIQNLQELTTKLG